MHEMDTYVLSYTFRLFFIEKIYLFITVSQRSGECYVFSPVCLFVCLSMGRVRSVRTLGHIHKIFLFEPHCTGIHLTTMSMFRLVHYEARTVGKAGGWHCTGMLSCL